MCLSATCMSCLEKCPFSSLAHLLIGSFIFLDLSYISCLYIFEISCLSVASFAIIFSHSEGCLFTLLIVSFVVQKFLILIRSHLFIFAFISIESVLMRWMKLEPIIQSEVSQKEKHQYSILTHIYGIQKDGNDNPVCETAKETQMYRTDFQTL